MIESKLTRTLNGFAAARLLSASGVSSLPLVGSARAA
jgi:hypothetical protein